MGQNSGLQSVRTAKYRVKHGLPCSLAYICRWPRTGIGHFYLFCIPAPKGVLSAPDGQNYRIPPAPCVAPDRFPGRRRAKAARGARQGSPGVAGFHWAFFFAVFSHLSAPHSPSRALWCLMAPVPGRHPPGEHKRRTGGAGAENHARR